MKELNTKVFLITGTWQGSNCSKLYKEVGWETLTDSRCCMRSLQIHKIKNITRPSFPLEKLPPNRRPIYTLNNSNTFHKIRCRCKNSFFPDAISSWNNIMRNFQNVPPLTSGKTHIVVLVGMYQWYYHLSPAGRRIFYI